MNNKFKKGPQVMSGKIAGSEMSGKTYVGIFVTQNQFCKVVVVICIASLQCKGQGALMCITFLATQEGRNVSHECIIVLHHKLRCDTKHFGPWN